MARKFLTAIDLSKNELQNAAIQNLAGAPAAPVKGQLYMNTTDNTLYWWDGAQWIAAKGAAGATPAGTVTTSAVADAGVVGVSTNFAREDHKHGRESFGASTAQTAFGAAQGNGSAVTVAHSDHTHGTPVHDNAAHAAIKLNALAVPDGPVSMNGQLLTSVGTPVSGTDAANKAYVDNIAAGLVWKAPARIASTGNQALSGLAAIDGVTPIANDRILLKNQTAPAENGIWVAAAGAWARGTDADSSAELVDAAVFVAEGTVNADTAWVQTANAPITVGTTGLTWVQFAGGGAVTAGAGMTQSGNTINVIGDASVTVTADQISRAALTGDVTAAAGANATTIANGVVGNGKLATMAQNTIKGRYSPGTGVPEDLGPLHGRFVIGALTVKSMGSTAGTTTVFNHAMDSVNVIVQVYEAGSPFALVEPDIEHTSNMAVTVRFATAVAANAYTILVAGVETP